MMSETKTIFKNCKQKNKFFYLKVILQEKKICPHRDSNTDQRFRKPQFYPVELWRQNFWQGALVDFLGNWLLVFSGLRWCSDFYVYQIHCDLPLQKRLAFPYP